MDGQGDQFGADSKPALVCHCSAFRGTQEKEALESALTTIGYHAEFAATAEEALGKIPTAQYEVIVLDEAFDGSTLENNAVLKALQEMLMVTRRSIVVALLGSQFTTGDPMMAFAQSVNVVIHPNDVGNLSTILQHAIAENNELFRTLIECFHEVGMGA